MATITDVEIWLRLDRGIDHVLVATKSGWNQTACGVITPNGEIHENTPDRICRKCRKVMPNLKLRC